MLHLLSMLFFGGIFLVSGALLSLMLSDNMDRIAIALGLSARTPALPPLPPRRREMPVPAVRVVTPRSPLRAAA